MNRHAERKRYLDAIRRREFTAYIQKIVNAENFQVGGEVLSRWNNPEKGIVGPGEFISQMIKTDTIVELDYYMFEEACKQQEEWASFGKSMFLTCNFTRITIGESDFSERIFSIAKKYNFNRSRIVIEITEDCVETNSSVAFANIANVKRFGFTIALDDFGSGSTSFDDFSNYPVDIVKIDRQMLLDAEEEDGRKTLHNLISIASRMGMKVLCEGVEVKEQAEMLKSFGCDYLQGFYFGRPEPKENIA